MKFAASLNAYRRRHGRRIAIEQAVFWSAVGGLLLIWPHLSETLPSGTYIVGGVLLSVANGVAVYLKRPGAQ
ncbi:MULTISPECIES: hypothetical protein [unclassified Bradyrhizobium]|uniref:hypothetical protein n=1 Tax=unclassified Bradyrhizobium TaxID=2631580 RepID=UPI001BA7E2B3|nr:MULTISPECIES: hypothetical protein [unclassified Bradyrhizobium]MBR1206625.1 hypothetical protein [Bradyrhizobium sp. AUGA SZCCT0124]MBR1315397.1 hypothetical protein [Bradyrhizobium sp. AUGA SZCCT0051]MBR1338541.1 hypothetical protein [Bradyrhizobium sp. AUGA SZCCT0105]MBR1356196.1 hypothetical protein [Bradyrhizobium sp. AUGA SZCCT0045]